MELRQINYFMWVYEEGSFSRAATKTKVAQPALSMQIKRLEEEFGVQLFERFPRGAKPTDAGRKLYRRCAAIMQQVVGAEEDLRLAEKGARLRGRIHVGVSGMFNRSVLKRVLLPFIENYPLIEVVVSESYTGTLATWVKDGTIDFALSSKPAFEGSLVQRLIFNDRVVLLTGAPVFGPSFTPVNLSQTKDLKLIIPSAHHSFGGLAKVHVESGAIKAAKLLEINSTIGSLTIALDSDWVVLSSFMAMLDYLSDPQAFIYPVAEPFMPFDLYVVFDRRRPLSAAAQQFVKAVETELRKVDAIWRSTQAQ